jgi:hypothetical protein
MCLQSHSSSGAVIKPTAEQSHLPSQLVTVFKPALINDVVARPVIMPIQVTRSAWDLMSECYDVDNNSKLCVLPLMQLYSGTGSVSK